MTPDTPCLACAAKQAEIDRLHRVVMQLAERIAAASEVLSKVAERKAGKPTHDCHIDTDANS